MSLELDGNQPYVHFSELPQKTNNLQNISLANVQCENSKLEEAAKKGHFPKLQGISLKNPSRDIEKLLSILDALKLNHFSIKNGGRDLNMADFVQHKAIFNVVSLDLRILKFSDRRLSKLLSIKNKFANLETLNLIDCDLTVHDMRCLAQIGAEGSLPVIKHLDVSKNHRIYVSKHLLEFGCRWENLKSLNIENIEETSTSFDDFWHLSQKSSTGNLPVLEDLSLSTQIVDYLQKSKNLYFRNLKKLRISCQALSPKQILHPLVHFIERKDSFGSLSSVTVRGYFAEQSQLNLSSDRQRLRANRWHKLHRVVIVAHVKPHSH